MRRIPLTQGKFAIVDNKDFEQLNKYKWYAHKDRCGRYYALRGVWDIKIQNSITIPMHRQILGLNYKDGKESDHKDRNGLNNQRYNLRICTKAENLRNSIKKGHNCSSKYKGVDWREKKEKWRARIHCNRKTYFLGYYESEVKAARVYDKAAIELFGEYAKTNF